MASRGWVTESRAPAAPDPASERAETVHDVAPRTKNVQAA